MGCGEDSRKGGRDWAFRNDLEGIKIGALAVPLWKVFCKVCKDVSREFILELAIVGCSPRLEMKFLR